MKQFLSILRNLAHVASGVLLVNPDPRYQAAGAALALIATGGSQVAAKHAKDAKSKTGPLLVVALCVLLSPGCTNLSQTETANLIAQRAGYRITERVLLKHPDWQPHFEQARAELIALLAQPRLDALAIIDILDRLPTGALDGDEAVIVVDGLYITVLVAGDPALTPEGEAALRAVVDGLVKGMNRRLGPPSP